MPRIIAMNARIVMNRARQEAPTNDEDGNASPQMLLRLRADL
jgi:hypothetical protein